MTTSAVTPGFERRTLQSLGQQRRRPHRVVASARRCALARADAGRGGPAAQLAPARVGLVEVQRIEPAPGRLGGQFEHRACQRAVGMGFERTQQRLDQAALGAIGEARRLRLDSGVPDLMGISVERGTRVHLEGAQLPVPRGAPGGPMRALLRGFQPIA